MEKAFKETIVLEANPHYYDYIHRLTLNPDKTCNFIDGGGQFINGHWSGTWTISLSEKLLKLTYHEVDNYGQITKLDPPIKKDIDIEVTNEHNKLFNGYCLIDSNQTWNFSKTPCPSFERRNLYNILNNMTEENSPLTFYICTNDSDYKNSSFSDVLTIENLRYADKNQWQVDQNDYRPIVDSIRSGLSEMKSRVEQMRQEIKDFAVSNKDKLPKDFKFNGGQDDLSKLSAIIGELKETCPGIDNVFENIQKLHFSNFNEVYSKFKKSKYYFNSFGM